MSKSTVIISLFFKKSGNILGNIRLFKILW